MLKRFFVLIHTRREGEEEWGRKMMEMEEEESREGGKEGGREKRNEDIDSAYLLFLQR